MRPTRNYRRLTAKEKRLLRKHGHRIRVRDLAKILGRSETAVMSLRRRYSPRRKGVPVSLETAVSMYRHGALEPDVRFSYSREDTNGLLWEEWQLNDLKSRIGREPLKNIATDIGKSYIATRKKAWALGLQPTVHTVSRLAKRLGIPSFILAGWTRQRSGRTEGYRVRHYREGRFVVVHRDDAEWLLEHKEQARRGEFEDHPGKLHEYEIKDGE